MAIKKENKYMIKKYSQKKINQILLTKQLNEFYLAIIENRQEILTDEEYTETINREKISYGDNIEKEVDSLLSTIKANHHLKDFKKELMKILYSASQIRHLAILTFIDNNVYDIGNAKFVNLKRNKIIHYDNLANYYDETNARIRIFTPKEEPQLKVNAALLDVDDESIISVYGNTHVTQEESTDLTSAFFKEVNGKAYIIKK